MKSQLSPAWILIFSISLTLLALFGLQRFLRASISLNQVHDESSNILSHLSCENSKLGNWQHIKLASYSKNMLQSLEKNQLLGKNGVCSTLYRFSTNKGYNGAIHLILALKNKKPIWLGILSHQETPGIGDKIEENKSHFLKKTLLTLQKSWGEPSFSFQKEDSISGATVSSHAVLQSILELIFQIQKESSHEKNTNFCSTLD